eukprot:gb/GECG01004209.1/.p1 GENE.gb/GECG01004209.1/~~gb/GECG01004209.1/.p1  ORF type:complete len:1506 (+),score=206.84 gb/GECG01004209.1/:1-4518(+)
MEQGSTSREAQYYGVDGYQHHLRNSSLYEEEEPSREVLHSITNDDSESMQNCNRISEGDPAASNGTQRGSDFNDGTSERTQRPGEPLHRIFHRVSAQQGSQQNFPGNENQVMNRKVSTDVRLDGSVKFINDWLTKRNGNLAFSTVMEDSDAMSNEYVAGSGQKNSTTTTLRATIDKDTTDPSGTFTLYHIRVSDGFAEWVVRKRFREFSTLHQTLHKKLPGHVTEMLPRLPPKKIMGVLQPDFIRERRRQLHYYLRKLTDIPAVRGCPEVVAFLSRDEYKPPPKVVRPNLSPAYHRASNNARSPLRTYASGGGNFPTFSQEYRQGSDHRDSSQFLKDEANKLRDFRNEDSSSQSKTSFPKRPGSLAAEAADAMHETRWASQKSEVSYEYIPHKDGSYVGSFTKENSVDTQGAFSDSVYQKQDDDDAYNENWKLLEGSDKGTKDIDDLSVDDIEEAILDSLKLFDKEYPPSYALQIEALILAMLPSPPERSARLRSSAFLAQTVKQAINGQCIALGKSVVGAAYRGHPFEIGVFLSRRSARNWSSTVAHLLLDAGAVARNWWMDNSWYIQRLFDDLNDTLYECQLDDHYSQYDRCLWMTNKLHCDSARTTYSSFQTDSYTRQCASLSDAASILDSSVGSFDRSCSSGQLFQRPDAPTDSSTASPFGVSEGNGGPHPHNSSAKKKKRGQGRASNEGGYKYHENSGTTGDASIEKSVRRNLTKLGLDKSTSERIARRITSSTAGQYGSEAIDQRAEASSPKSISERHNKSATALSAGNEHPALRKKSHRRHVSDEALRILDRSGVLKDMLSDSLSRRSHLFSSFSKRSPLNRETDLAYVPSDIVLHSLRVPCQLSSLNIPAYCVEEPNPNRGRRFSQSPQQRGYSRDRISCKVGRTVCSLTSNDMHGLALATVLVMGDQALNSQFLLRRSIMLADTYFNIELRKYLDKQDSQEYAVIMPWSSLVTSMLYVFSRRRQHILSPLHALAWLLLDLSTFPWDTHALTFEGKVPLVEWERRSRSSFLRNAQNVAEKLSEVSRNQRKSEKSSKDKGKGSVAVEDMLTQRLLQVAKSCDSRAAELEQACTENEEDHSSSFIEESELSAIREKVTRRNARSEMEDFAAELLRYINSDDAFNNFCSKIMQDSSREKAVIGDVLDPCCNTLDECLSIDSFRQLMTSACPQGVRMIVSLFVAASSRNSHNSESGFMSSMHHILPDVCNRFFQHSQESDNDSLDIENSLEAAKGRMRHIWNELPEGQSAAEKKLVLPDSIESLYAECFGVRKQDLWHQLDYIAFLLDSEVTSSAVVRLAKEVLSEKGSLPVGEIGKLLQEATSNSSLSSILKEKWGGLKKFLEQHPDVFSLSSDHPFNPSVSLCEENVDDEYDESCDDKAHSGTASHYDAPSSSPNISAIMGETLSFSPGRNRNKQDDTLEENRFQSDGYPFGSQSSLWSTLAWQSPGVSPDTHLLGQLASQVGNQYPSSPGENGDSYALPRSVLDEIGFDGKNSTYNGK